MLVFFFNDTATTEIYTLSLHDALPISVRCPGMRHTAARLDLVRRLRAEPAEPVLRIRQRRGELRAGDGGGRGGRSEEHTSELQSPCNIVCRLLLEKKKYVYYDVSYVNI